MSFRVLCLLWLCRSVLWPPFFFWFGVVGCGFFVYVFVSVFGFVGWFCSWGLFVWFFFLAYVNVDECFVLVCGFFLGVLFWS